MWKLYSTLQHHTTKYNISWCINFAPNIKTCQAEHAPTFIPGGTFSRIHKANTKITAYVVVKENIHTAPTGNKPTLTEP